MKIPLVDDLQLVTCTSCMGSGKPGPGRFSAEYPQKSVCPGCHGDGLRVVRHTSFLEVRVLTRTQKKLERKGGHAHR